MGLMTENKAQRLLQDYMAAELKGDDQLAQDIEKQLNAAGWRISVGAEGYTVIRENGGLFAQNDSEINPNSPLYAPVPKNGSTTNTTNLPLIIGISVGTLILILAIILAIRAYKQSKNVVSG